MKPTATIISLLLAAAISTGRAEEAKQTGAERVEELIGELSSDSFKEREEATRELWSVGDAALESLRRASGSDDPERAFRAAELLEKVELRITPETPAAVLDQIQRFRRAPQNLKANHINELKRSKAYFQILKLYSLEKKPEARLQMAASIRGVAMLGAREAIAADDFQTALQLLSMSAHEPNDLIALAWVYRCMGKLAEGAEDPPAPKGVATDVWKITLLRVKGDIEGAVRLAAESRQLRLLAGLKVLTGDPTLWLRQNGLGDSRQRALDAYVDVALKRWEGGETKDSDFAPLIAIMNSPDSDEKIEAMSSLAALGRMAEVEKVQAKDDAALGFEYYLAQERVGEALELIGLDPVKPDYTAWVAARFKKLRDGRDHEEDGEAGSPFMQLLMLAGFLEKRGMEDVLDAAFTQPLGEFAKADQDRFMDFMRELFQPASGAPRYAVIPAMAWAGDDGNRWSDMYSAAFGEEKEVMEWLAWIGKIEPGVSRPDTLKAMLALFGMGADPDHLRAKWLGKAWKFVGESPDDEKASHIRRIMALGVAGQDVATALRARDMLDGKDKASASWSSIDKFLSAASRWKDAAEMLENGRDTNSSSPELHAYLAATLRRAGFEKRAAEHDAWAEKLSLGYGPTCSRIGDYYIYGGDVKRANEWYRRAAFHADVSGGELPAVLDTYARAALEDGQWDIAASCYEAMVHVYASAQFSGGALQNYSKARLNADLAKALASLPKDRERAIAMLAEIHRNFATDGVLADDFFPLLREVGLEAELKRWFADSWEKISAVVKRFPDSDNTKNTAAWLAARAGMRLPEAEKYLTSSLARNPDQAAYLDTMAEVHFANGDREGALKWSEKSLLRYPLTDSPYDVMIRRQHERFRNAPLPKW